MVSHPLERAVVKLDFNTLDFLDEYRSLSIAAAKNRTQKSYISRICNRKGRLSLNGCIYMFKDDYESMTNEDIRVKYTRKVSKDN